MVATPALQRRAVNLARATVAWNLVEASVALAAGVVAGSIALVSFGLDSSVEVLSSLVILWQFRGLPEERERRASQCIAVSFFVIAVYITAQASWDLANGNRPENSPVGIGLAVAALVVMPILAGAKRRTGRQLSSPTVVADGGQSMLCAYMAGALLCALVLDSAFHWWWADGIAALAIALIAVSEGLEAWRGEVA